VADFKAINKELKEYSVVLASAPQIVVLNKCDILPEEELKKAVTNFAKKTKTKPIAISGITRNGLDNLLKEVVKTLEKIPPLAPLEYEPFEYAPRDTTEYDIIKTDDGFEIVGGMMDELQRNVVLDNPDSVRYFQKRLKDQGVLKALRRAGIQEGDTVRILDVEFEYNE